MATAPTPPDPADIARQAGSDFEYQYREVTTFRREAVEGYIATTRRLFSRAAKAFDDRANTEWFVRSYLALKFILAATLQANAARYAEEHNLRLVRPYLAYYAMLSCCRAFLFTLPCLPWKGERSIEEKHGTIIKTAADKLKRLDAGEATKVLGVLNAAREQRNLLSYRFPASGLNVFGEDIVDLDETIHVARLFTELAHLNIACLEGAVRKLVKGPFQLLDDEELWRTIRYETPTAALIDDEDHIRVGYFLRKYRRPVALSALATAGLVEDFFGAWAAEIPDGFDPDEDWDLLLDIS